MAEIKLPAKELIISAFFGGMVLSVLELMNACFRHENIFDPYFFGGMAFAGLLGVFGLFISQTKDIGGAITAGIAAPQLIGGIAKTGGAVTSAALSIFMGSTLYAQNADSIVVTTFIESKNTLRVETSEGKSFFVQDSMKFKLARNETIVIKDENTTSDIINFNDMEKDSVILELNSRKFIVQEKSQNFFRGLFAQQYVQKKQTDENKIEVTKKWTTKDP